MNWDAVWPLLALTAWLALLFWPFALSLEIDWPAPPGSRSVCLSWILGPWRLRLFAGGAGADGAQAAPPAWKEVAAVARDLGRLVQEVQDLRGEVELGTGDAAGSALLAGLAWGVWGTVLAYLQRRLVVRRVPRMVIAPRYGEGGVAVRLRCILRTRLVHVMGAAPTLKILGGRRHVRRDAPHG